MTLIKRPNTAFGNTSVVRRYCVGIGFALIAAFPGAATAQDWWVGIWAFDTEWCAVADRIGSVTPAPIAITETEVLGYENTCAIAKARELGGVGAVHLKLNCQGEGETYKDQRLILKQDDQTIWIWWGNDEPVAFHRCKG